MMGDGYCANCRAPGQICLMIGVPEEKAAKRSSLHAEVLKQQLGLLRQRRGVTLVHDLTGLQNIDAVGDRERAIEVLLDQQDRQARRA